MAIDPRTTFKSNPTLSRTLQSLKREQPQQLTRKPTGAWQIPVAIGGGLGAAASGGGVTPTTPSPQGPLHSPWYEALIEAPNNDPSTAFNFGLKTVITTIAIRYYWRRYVGSGTDPIGMGKMTILHDGSTPVLLPEVEYGADTIASGITMAVNISSDQVQLLLAVDNSGGDVAFWVQYQIEGVTAASAKGEISVVRGTRRTQGNWGIITDGVNVRPYLKTRGSDDCGISVAGDITSGVLNLTVSADNSDTDDSAVALTVLVTGRAGIREWQRVNLSVPDNSSASENFRSDTDGQIDWGSADLTIPASSSDSVTFDFAFGALWLLVDIYRGSLVEMHEIPLWKDYTGALLADDIWWDESAGVTFTASLSGAALVLDAATDGITDDAVVRISFLPVLSL